METQKPFQTQPPKAKKSGCLKIVAIAVGIVVVISVISAIFSDDSATKQKEASTEKTNADATKEITIGDTLKTDYFEIIAHSVNVTDMINTGNKYSDLQAEPGTRFLIVDASFKNIDTESRMLTDGELYVSYKGKDYIFDKSETILAPGYGLLLDQINPLTKKSTKIVYKIPSELRGSIYWQPGRADSNQRILLGEITE